MRTCLLILAACILLCAVPATAAPTAKEMKAAIDALEARLKAQEGLLEELETRSSRDWKLEMGRIARELADDAGGRAAGPGWLENLKFHGDFRLRLENNCAEDENHQRRAKDRNRARFRLRVGLLKTWLDEQLTVGFRLVSGDGSNAPYYSHDDPTTANQTFTGLFNRKAVWIDRAYAVYKPKALPGLTVAGGKLAPPFVHTDLIWDSDLNVEGFWAQYAKAFGPIKPFVNAGYFIAYERAPYVDDQYDTVLMFYQLGTNWQLCKQLKWTFAASYYDYDHTDVIPNGEYQMVNLTNKVGFSLFGLPWSVYVDYVHNCGNKMTSGDEKSQDDGLAVGLNVGKNAKKGDWAVLYKYAYIETYCTPHLFNDATFGHTNVRGHVLRARYNLTDFLTVGGSVYLRQRIAGSTQGAEWVTTQLDVAWSF